jgi:8-oxo-dGTP diphosphatase
MKQDEVAKYKYKPRAAVNNLIFTQNGKVLLVKRSKKDGLENFWGGIGGKIEYLEPAAKASIRELREETGLRLSNPKFIGVTENISCYPHYIVLWFAYLVPKANNVLLDNSENSQFGWFSISNPLPKTADSTRLMIRRGWEVIASEHSLP